MGEWVDGWMMDARMDRWTDGWMDDGWTDRPTSACLLAPSLTGCPFSELFSPLPVTLLTGCLAYAPDHKHLAMSFILASN